jgi:DNA repair exonuclease SbcCD ATPase subunit
MGRLIDHRKRADAALAKLATAKEMVRREKRSLRIARKRLRTATQAREIATSIAEAVQRQAHEHIAGMVTRCLHAVFGEEAYEFEIVFEKKRNKTEARPVLHRNGHEFDPLREAGGGIVDVAAFALRLAVLMTARPPVRRFIVLDEPFRFVSAAYIDRLRQLLMELAKTANIQFVVITHHEDLRAGKVVEL